MIKIKGSDMSFYLYRRKKNKERWPLWWAEVFI